MISIIIPVKNNPSGLGKLLNSLCEEGLPPLPAFEIIVINDAGTDNIHEVVNQSGIKEIRVLDLPESHGSYYARNRGAEIAKGEWLIFLDSDVIMSKNWFSNLLPCMESADYVAGNIRINKTGKETPGQQYYRATAFDMDRYYRKYKAGVTAFLAVKSLALKDCGMFDERFFSGADFLLGQEITQKGYSVKFCEKAFAYHHSRTFKEQFYSILRMRKGRNDIAKRFPGKYPSFENNFLHLFREFRYLMTEFISALNGSHSASGKISRPILLKGIFLNYLFIIVSELLIGLFPTKKFNY